MKRAYICTDFWDFVIRAIFQIYTKGVLIMLLYTLLVAWDGYYLVPET